ncbi:hypothetical protein FLJC2902T_04110 [Flavobacterium limnosediminis JC2902]|uniref:G:T/U mismatch-specific DNA glycosylase n=1 Tax=Flavobacterium limnosediminis JC2902 TaxID=1341181 RepID=V6SZT0_9FLAO|nr:hypothetical protein [Flavobacterium limnosediminis]ESU29930.1 hypothetical protein FLJC2902T_04110 [Flavobacterium limnosediminis JC2902]
MITTHQYLEKYPILKDSEKLIVGTIHPHNHADFALPFFYGNVASIWKILSEAFPGDLQQPLTLEGILTFLQKKKIAISDVILKCERTTPTAFDSDLIPLELNQQILSDIKNSNITEIFFTSGFQKNGAFRLFYVNILGKRITQDIRQKREVVEDTFFGRPIKLTVLYSPSGSSNIGLSKSKLFLENKDKYKDSKKPIHDFKVDYYRDKFDIK